MDQFNKVLAVFLLLVVAVGISIFIFSRLGILSRILPSNKLVSPTVVTQITLSSTPTQTVTPVANKTGILGWLSQLGKPKATLTPSPTPNPKPQSPNLTKQPTPTTNSKPEILQPEADPSLAENSNKSQPLNPTKQPTSPFISDSLNPNITIIPYGSASVPTYPASGVEILFTPALTLSALFGLLLKHRARK